MLHSTFKDKALGAAKHRKPVGMLGAALSGGHSHNLCLHQVRDSAFGQHGWPHCGHRRHSKPNIQHHAHHPLRLQKSADKMTTNRELSHMNPITKKTITTGRTVLALCAGVLCASCTLTQESSFEQVIQKRYDSGGKLVGAYRTFYCGSDDEYDYYTCTSFPTRHYKVKTTPHLFYPAPIPFKGWLMSDRYYFSMYRGRIILKSMDQHYQLERYRNRPGDNYPRTSARVELEAMNEWCLRNWGSERLRIPDAKNGYSQPEWSYLQESIKPPYCPTKTGIFTYNDPRF